MPQSEPFNPDENGHPNYAFGIPAEEENAGIVIIPAPWEPTVSYGRGTSKAPGIIKKASQQIDIYDIFWGEPWRAGWFMREEQPAHKEKSNYLTEQVDRLRESDSSNAEKLKEVDDECRNFLNELGNDCQEVLTRQQFPVIVGGEHTCALPLINALAKKETFGILQIDAHADLHPQFEGLTYSHATVMHQALKEDNVQSIVNVGLRDFAAREARIIGENSDRYIPYLGSSIAERLYDGGKWRNICNEIVYDLPDKVYISFDIDGLEPWLCPGTGTPVPGGLEYFQAIALLREIVEAGKQIIGFDLSETAPSETNLGGNTASRILYNLCSAVTVSNKLPETPHLRKS